VFSNAAQYALRAVSHLGARDHSGFVPVRVIAEELEIPPTFLAKVLKQLVDTGFLKAYRGPTGGVMLARPTTQITVRQIVEAIDGPELFTECILGLPGCGDRLPCPMHEGWSVIRTQLAADFDRQTIETISEACRNGSLRLTP
jgi:Rrf2 family iron-sulfur cluster assembly transcriptional regulator